tara:strand:- start:3291 stop:4682 length:1392 start_codon:yes stop_codon:yes gene_type:complete
MKTSEALQLIIDIENSFDTSSIRWQGLITWPLLRKILWFKLISIDIATSKKNVKKFKNIFGINKSFLLSLIKKTKINQYSEKIFFSRPEYLQKIETEKYIDRIVDPIIQSCNIRNISKYYFRNIPKEKKMVNDYYQMLNIPSLHIISIKKNQINTLNKIAGALKIDNVELQLMYRQDLSSFSQWFRSAKKLLLKHKNLKEIYLTCWYTTETMGICAAARQLGIKTIDIQHGKQGKYQAMYSGWTVIPESGYSLMPDKFWCWGKPSCDHILASSPNRKIHLPFVGGYPWVDYYKKNISSCSYEAKNKKIKVLVTLQSPQGSNIKRLPDFIIKFLSNCDTEDIEFIFRLHPNDKDGYASCKESLRSINEELYTIDNGSSNLYDIFKYATHHVTAYSSCCYEASLFNIPTLLYGEESKEIYEDDIKSHMFIWINSDVDSFAAWLYSDDYISRNISDPYINNIKYNF